MKNVIRYGIPLVVSVGLCYLLFTGIDFREMVAIIRDGCNFWWIGLALALSVVSHVFRALRWDIQLKAIGINARLSTLIYSIFGTYSVNLVFPRLGELWRTGYISRRQKAPFAKVFGSMIADRLADTLTVLLLTLLALVLARDTILSFIRQNPTVYGTLSAVVSSPVLWGCVAVLVAAVWWFLKRKSENPKIIRAKEAVKGHWHGFSAIFKMKGKLRWLLLTVLLWGCYFTQLYVAFFAFGFTTETLHDYGITAVLVCFVLSSISMGVPSNGGIGPWQWAVVFVLSGIYRGDYLHSVSFANLVLGSQTLLLILLGVYTFATVAFSKRDVMKKDGN